MEPPAEAPIENLLTNLVKLEQYVSSVVNCTSNYNSSNSDMYAPVNIKGKYIKYPSYGDFPDAYQLRHYGNWEKLSDSYQSHYNLQDADPLDAQDYITLRYDNDVIPRDICIYEIYNPGAVVRVWGEEISNNRWVLLWKGPPQVCPDESRKFHLKIRTINTFIRRVRLEFNHSLLKYHSSIDAVLLGGYQASSNLQFDMILNGLVYITKKDKLETSSISEKHDIISDDLFSNLIYEIILHIFQFLDLKSLSRCARVNKRWSEAANDTILYKNLSLKKYWNLVDERTMDYFSSRCFMLKKLDLSWCGLDITNFNEKLIILINQNSSTLTHLALCESCITNDVITVIANCKELTDLRLKNTTNWTDSTLDQLHNLKCIDLTATQIDDADLIKLIVANRNLEHIIIDLCENLANLNYVAQVVGERCRNLVTWRSWKTKSLTSDGIKYFGNLSRLKELDLGWCLLDSDPGNCLERIAMGCPQLTRLILSEWRSVTDQSLLRIILNCKQLQQLDLLGIRNITADICEKAFVMLPNLLLIDISYCDSIRNEQVDIWRQKFPKITIQCSCQYVVIDYLN